MNMRGNTTLTIDQRFGIDMQDFGIWVKLASIG
jgi:hypothetical protein